MAWFDHTGKRRTKCSRTTDRAAAERIVAELESDAALRRDGVVDPAQDRYADQARRPIGEHLNDFRAHLRSKGNTEQHCVETHAQVKTIIDLCKAEFIADLTASGVQRAVKVLRDFGRSGVESKPDAGLSLKTCNHYLRAVKGFGRWLHRDKRTCDDVLASSQSYNADTDPRRVRRELPADELQRLILTTEGRTRPEHKISGADRAMADTLALGTGFRAEELRSLTPACFDLDADRQRSRWPRPIPNEGARTRSRCGETWRICCERGWRSVQRANGCLNTCP